MTTETGKGLKCTKQLAMPVAKGAKFLLGPPAKSQFIAMTVFEIMKEGEADLKNQVIGKKTFALKEKLALEKKNLIN